MKVRSLFCAVLFSAYSMSAMVSTAQENSNNKFFIAFSGDWFSFDPKMTNGDRCSITLSTHIDTVNSRKATSNGCVAPLDAINGWQIVEGQIRLMKEERVQLTTGGNQFRLSGEDEDGKSVILERAAGDNNSQSVRSAIAKYRCIYKGFTDKCATSNELAPPSRDGAELETLVNLNIRAQPRVDSSILGVVPKGSKLTTSQCIVTTDGYWCKAQFGEDFGWFTRTALRDETWPVMTVVLSSVF